MRCPFCGAHDTRVLDSRLVNEGDQVKRRRECSRCKERFNTFESVELILPYIIKRNGLREVFNEQKLRNGMIKALEKRPVLSSAVDEAVERIKKELMDKGEREIDSQKLGEKVMNELRQLDGVAYIRFASVYFSFQDVNEFTDMIARLQKHD
jgi:transcriptional repressor NrdR